MLPLNPTFKKYFIAFALLISLVVVFGLFKSCKKEVKKNDVVKVIPLPTQYTDDGGTTHTENTVLQNETISQINTFYQNIIDSLTKVIKAKPKLKAVQSVTLVGSDATGSFKPIIDTVYRDTIYHLPPVVTINYKDKWLKLKGFVNTDSLWQYQIKDSIALITYWRRKHWYSTRELYVDGFSFNPNSHLSGLQGFKLNAAKPKKWGIGFQVGYGFNSRTLSPYIGIGIQRNFIRF